MLAECIAIALPHIACYVGLFCDPPKPEEIAQAVGRWWLWHHGLKTSRPRGAARGREGSGRPAICLQHGPVVQQEVERALADQRAVVAIKDEQLNNLRRQVAEKNAAAQGQQLQVDSLESCLREEETAGRALHQRLRASQDGLEAAEERQTTLRELLNSAIARNEELLESRADLSQENTRLAKNNEELQDLLVAAIQQRPTDDESDSNDSDTPADVDGEPGSQPPSPTADEDEIEWGAFQSACVRRPLNAALAAAAAAGAGASGRGVGEVYVPGLRFSSGLLLPVPDVPPPMPEEYERISRERYFYTEGYERMRNSMNAKIAALERDKDDYRRQASEAEGDVEALQQDLEELNYQVHAMYQESQQQERGLEEAQAEITKLNEQTLLLRQQQEESRPSAVSPLSSSSSSPQAWRPSLRFTPTICPSAADSAPAAARPTLNRTRSMPAGGPGVQDAVQEAATSPAVAAAAAAVGPPERPQPCAPVAAAAAPPVESEAPSAPASQQGTPTTRSRESRKVTNVPAPRHH
ncbi:unnamed protein product [Vitrella brassicaformis CCMP3155]|uniref:Uncharacterized protein n=1 Tax=Vitrella brassicaformis (strain CCMP3155) TaxID=1169540 RepID=A0A0G4H1H9_VITBC|nr:unnamed protein product [Vitrella brassicaformis CCMP3155]|eukprot:CEM37456.1 unnamed protein product [Vitrella brassicaformis CCMP3155]